MTPQQSPPVRVELRSDRKTPPLVEDDPTLVEDVVPGIPGIPPFVDKRKTRSQLSLTPRFYSSLRGEDLNLRPSGYEAKIGPFRLTSQRHEIIHNH